MNWINIISNNDTIIKKICINDENIIILTKLWNGDEKRLQFNHYRAIKEKCSIEQIIGDVIINKESPLLGEIKKDIINGDGEEDEIKGIKSFIFMDEWNEVVLLEVLADSVEIK